MAVNGMDSVKTHTRDGGGVTIEESFSRCTKGRGGMDTIMPPLAFKVAFTV
jgi:hypothetical protein